MKPKIVFFGTPDYSLIVLRALFEANYPIACVVTKPPRPMGRDKILEETPVALWAKEKHIPVLTPQSDPQTPHKFKDEATLVKEIMKYKPDIAIAANYAQKIPQSLLSQLKFGGLNVHPSLLPAYRGPAPVPWAIMNGETETGVSVVTLTEEFDAGTIIAQEKENITPTDTTHTLLTRLFEKGAALLVQVLLTYIKNPQQRVKPHGSPSHYGRMNRDTGFELWENIKKAIATGKDAGRIERKWRALHPWPGLWTRVKLKVQSEKFKVEDKRLKILKLHLSSNFELRTSNLVVDEIQLEGKTPVKITAEILKQLN